MRCPLLSKEKPYIFRNVLSPPTFLSWRKAKKWCWDRMKTSMLQIETSPHETLLFPVLIFLTAANLSAILAVEGNIVRSDWWLLCRVLAQWSSPRSASGLLQVPGKSSVPLELLAACCLFSTEHELRTNAADEGLQQVLTPFTLHPLHQHNSSDCHCSFLQHPMPTTHQGLPSSTTSWAEYQGLSSHTHPRDSYTPPLEMPKAHALEMRPKERLKF